MVHFAGSPVKPSLPCRNVGEVALSLGPSETVTHQEPPLFEAVSQLAAEHAELEGRLADPAIHSDQSLARRLGQRYAE